MRLLLVTVVKSSINIHIDLALSILTHSFVYMFESMLDENENLSKSDKLKMFYKYLE